MGRIGDDPSSITDARTCEEQGFIWDKKERRCMERTSFWTKEANKYLKGKRIKSARYLTDREAKSRGWDGKCVVIQFEDGSAIYPSSDEEGNEAGALFGQTKEGKSFILPLLYPHVELLSPLELSED